MLDVAAPDSTLARLTPERWIAAIRPVAFVVADRGFPALCGKRCWTLPHRLFEGDQRTPRLLRHDPFPDRPPRYVRAVLYRDRFTAGAERRQTGARLPRELALGEVAPPVELGPKGLGADVDRP